MLKFLHAIGVFIAGVAAILTFLYGQAFVRQSPILPGLKQDDSEQITRDTQLLHQDLTRARGELQKATEARASAETELKAKDARLQQLELALRDRDSRVQQLETILRDKDSRIRQLETSTQSQVPSPAPARQQILRLLEADAVRVSLTRAERLGERFSLVLTLENVGKDDIRIDLKSHTLKLVDDRGEEWKLADVTGFVTASLVLPAGGKSTSRVTFNSKGPGGSTFDFVGTVILLRSGLAAEQTVAFSNLRPQ